MSLTRVNRHAGPETRMRGIAVGSEDVPGAYSLREWDDGIEEEAREEEDR